MPRVTLLIFPPHELIHHPFFRRRHVAGLGAIASAASSSSPAPVRALLITGGCCHDYDAQAKALTEGSKKFGNVE